MDATSALPPAATASIGGSSPSAPVATSDPATAAKAARDFEAFFLSQSFETMFSGVDTDSLFGGGEGESIYRSLLIQEYSKLAARNGGVGIASAVQQEILRSQEVK